MKLEAVEEARQAVWDLKHASISGRDPLDALAALQQSGPWSVRVAPPRWREHTDGVWRVFHSIRSIVPGTVFSGPVRLYRRATPEGARGVYWATSPLIASMHTMGKPGATFTTLAPRDAVVASILLFDPRYEQHEVIVNPEQLGEIEPT